MKLAVMQPYLFPYLGYFQLLRAADAFVVFDDVNYIKGGWINRNFILTQRGKQLITLPLQRASQNKLINQITVDEKKHKLIETIRQAYGKAPQFTEVFPLIEDILEQEEVHLDRFLDYQLRRICSYLDLSPRWYISSALKKDHQLRGQEKVLAICEELDASHYLNLIGGRGFYNRDAFANRGLQLSFIQSKQEPYPQFSNAFVPELSIIDILMFNDQEQCSSLLNSFEFV